MSKPLIVCPDAERLAIDYLTAQLAARDEDVTVGVDLPAGWTLTSKAHVQVACDGTPIADPPFWRSTVRVTTWHKSPTTGKRLAALCEGLLLAHPGAPSWAGCRPGTGLFLARDAATKAPLASITVLAKLRGSAL